MIPLTAGQLETMMDAASLWSFGITALLLIMMTVRYTRTSPKKAAKSNLVGFDRELRRSMEKPGRKGLSDGAFHGRGEVPHQRVVSLAGSGLSTVEIARRTNMPRGEVELILRLNRFGLGSMDREPEQG